MKLCSVQPLKNSSYWLPKSSITAHHLYWLCLSSAILHYSFCSKLYHCIVSYNSPGKTQLKAYFFHYSHRWSYSIQSASVFKTVPLLAVHSFFLAHIFFLVSSCVMLTVINLQHYLTMTSVALDLLTTCKHRSRGSWYPQKNHKVLRDIHCNK